MNFPGYVPHSQQRGLRAESQLYTMQNSFLSQMAAQQHAQQQAHQQAAQQHALAQRAAAQQQRAVAQQQMINHRNAMMMDTSRMPGLTSPSAPPSFPSSLASIRLPPDQHNPASYFGRGREFMDGRSANLIGRPPPPVEPRPYSIPSRPSPPRPRRPSPPPLRTSVNIPSIGARPAEPAPRPAVSLRQGAFSSMSSHSFPPAERPPFAQPAPRPTATTIAGLGPRHDCGATMGSKRGSSTAGGGSDSDDSDVLEGTRKRRRRARAR